MATDLNIIVGVKSGDALRQLGNVRKQVDNVGAATRRTSGALRSHAKQYNATAVATNKFAKGALQQAGYQVGDFAVQIAGGTNALQAFGQQGSQLLGIFGPVGAVLGAAVAIVSAVGVAFTKLAGGAKEAKDAMQELQETTKALNQETAKFKFGVETAGEAKLTQELIDLKRTLATQYDDYNKAVKNEQVGLISRLEDAYQKTVRDIKAKEEQLRLLELARKENKSLINLNEQYLGQQMAAIRASRQIQKADQERIQAAIVAAGEQRGLIAETTRLGLEGAERLKQGYAEYYASRMQGEAMLVSGVRGGRGADPRQFGNLNEYLAQIAAGRKAKEDADEAAQAGTEKTAEIIRTQLSPELMRIKSVSEMVGTSFENAFMSMVKGTATAKDAFRALASDIISELYRVFVVKQITGFITGAVAGAFAPGSAAGTGGSFAPPVAPRAMGGPVRAGRPYLVGERGPELMVPSSNGAIIPNNQMGGGVVIVNQTINVTTGVQQTVRAEVLGLMPQIAEASKAAVLDAKRRGGAFAGAF